MFVELFILLALIALLLDAYGFLDADMIFMRLVQKYSDTCDVFVAALEGLESVRRVSGSFLYFFRFKLTHL